MPGKVTLAVIEGPFRGREFVFEQPDTFIFGRADDCHLPLPPGDTSASRYHFVLETSPPSVRLRDLGSLNGTFVNGRKIGGRDATESADAGRQRRFADVDLANGDRIAVGDTMFECRVQAGVAPTVIAKPKNGAVETVLKAAPRGSTVPAAPLPHAPTARGNLGDYEMVRSLARGGMAEVFLVRRRGDGAELALKTMLPQQDFTTEMRGMFLREVQVTKTVRHPNIVAIFDEGETDGTFWYVMELCRGGDLQDYTAARGGRLPLAELREIMCQALDGLAAVHLHSARFVHRDLKPQNLLFASSGGPVKVADFGIAKSFQNAGLSGLTVTGNFAGTYDFMPREQLINFKRVAPTSDVWAMAATFYFLATSTLPRDASPNQDPIGAVLAAPLVPFRVRCAHAPMALADVIDAALSDDVSRRPQDAAAFAAQLRSIPLI